MPPRTNDRAIAGPAFEAAAVPVSTKIPAPMIAPMPSIVRSNAVRDRLGPSLSLAAASAWRSAIDFRTNRFAIVTSRENCAAPDRESPAEDEHRAADQGGPARARSVRLMRGSLR